MAGTLVVQTLQGPTSGANANKVIIPSGQTLDLAGSTSGVNEIKVAEHWGMTSNLVISTTARTVISSNLSRASASGYGAIGAGMTESSGVFTFPSTGVWFVSYNTSYYADTDVRVIESHLQMTTDGSNYYTKALDWSHITRNNANNTTSGAVAQAVLDITDTSTHKVRFAIELTNTPVTFMGSSDNPLIRTDFMFIRLGDT